MEPRAADTRLSETTDCLGSLSDFRNDFGCWNFLYPKSALNLTFSVASLAKILLCPNALALMSRCHTSRGHME